MTSGYVNLRGSIARPVIRKLNAICTDFVTLCIRCRGRRFIIRKSRCCVLRSFFSRDCRTIRNRTRRMNRQLRKLKKMPTNDFTGLTRLYYFRPRTSSIFHYQIVVTGSLATRRSVVSLLQQLTTRTRDLNSHTAHCLCRRVLLGARRHTCRLRRFLAPSDLGLN